MATANPFRCGVVGYGGAFNMGRYHLDSMSRNRRMQVAAVCELDPARLRVAEEDYPGIATYRRLGDMLRYADLDLVTIITPHNTHAKLAMQCLEAGINVVCEKPLAITSKDVRRMRATAKRKRRMLSAFHCRRWDGDFMALQQLIRKEKIIGRIHRVECGFYNYGRHPDWWRADRAISGGSMYDWGAHFIDWVLQLVRDNLDWVSGYQVKNKEWKGYTNEDHSELTVRFKGGCLATVTISNLSMSPRPRWRILGEQGSIEPVDGKFQVKTMFGDHRMSTEVPYAETDWHKYYENICRHLTGRARLAVTPESAARVIGILEAANISARRNSANVKPAFK